jgi:hypothetical protein
MARDSITEGVVEFIRRGGEGGEAQVDVELRTLFSGIGGTILTRGGVTTALRKELGAVRGSGHVMFLRHMVIKKLDDFFYRSAADKAYVYSHVPRPLGSISEEGDPSMGIKPIEAYMYQWAQGNEGFSWEVQQPDGNSEPVTLADWRVFEGKFASAGINMSKDIADADDGRISKNIIHMFPYDIDASNRLSSIWQRIDFGMQSTPFDFHALEKFLRDRRSALEGVLKTDRYEMVRLAAKYINPAHKLDPREIGRLEVLIGAYRVSSLSHFSTKGIDRSSDRRAIYGISDQFLT